MAPWCLAFGLVLSITAEAGQDPNQSDSYVARSSAGTAGDAIRRAVAASRFASSPGEDETGAIGPPAIEAALTVGAPGDLDVSPDEIEPNSAIKSGAPSFPQIDRSAKGDPFFGLRPSFEARARLAPGAAPAPLGSDAEPEAGTTPGRPRGDEDDTRAPVALTFDDGATPAAPLDFALNSSTPRPNEGRLVVVATPTPPAQTTLAARTETTAQPDYAALIDPKDNPRQMRCLAEAIYFESRSEPEAGQAAVAQVVLNRVRSGIYPTSVCGVVYQDRNRPFACQFSFACEGKSLRIEEPGPWAVATRIAGEVVSGANYNPRVGEAVNYHATYVSPFWRGYLRQVDHIGLHVFYAMREGVNWAPGALNGAGDRPLAQ